MVALKAFLCMLLFTIVECANTKTKSCADTCGYCCVNEQCMPKSECTDSLVYILLVLLGVTFCIGVLLVLQNVLNHKIISKELRKTTVCYLRLYETEHRFKRAFHSHTKIDFDQFTVPGEKVLETSFCMFHKKLKRNKIIDLSFLSKEYNTSCGGSFTGRNKILSKIYIPVDSIGRIGPNNLIIYLLYSRPESKTEFLDGKDSIQIDIEGDSSDNRIHLKREYLDDSVMNMIEKRHEKNDSLDFNSFQTIEPRNAPNFRTIEHEKDNFMLKDNNSVYSTIGDRPNGTISNQMTTIGSVRKMKERERKNLGRIQEDSDHNESWE